MSAHLRPGTLAIILVLCAILVWQRRTISDLHSRLDTAGQTVSPSQAPSSAKANPSLLPNETAAPDVDPSPDPNTVALRERVRVLESQLAELSQPLNEETRSATVETRVGPEETLVTGGYRTPDGDTHFLFLRPTPEVLPDGRIAVKLAGNEIALTPEQLKGSDLESLATNASNTLQHGEAWQNDETDRVLGSLRETGVVSMPSVITMPGHEAEIQVENGVRFRATPDLLDDGSFHLRLHMAHDIDADQP